MKINFFTLRYQPLNINQRQNYNTQPPSTQPKLNITPAFDTVTFSAKNKKPVPATTTFADHLEAQFEAESVRYMRLATTYLDILESVTNALGDKGFSMDREYCELNPVKSAKSYRSKVERSKSLKVPDTIRATIYCKDSYDISNLNDLLAEMEKREFIVAPAEMPVKDLIKRGYLPTEEESLIVNYLNGDRNIDNKAKVISELMNKGYDALEISKLLNEFEDSGKIPTSMEFIERFSEINKEVPDLDIRLKDKVATERYKLQPEHRYCISKPQSSGYEDIQIRFVRKYDKKSNPVQHELIILFGPNYAKSKHNESERVYSHLRKFDTLNIASILKNENYERDTKNANLYLSLIRTLFRTNVSEKEFENGRNIDYKGSNEQRTISFSKDDERLFNSYFKILNEEIDKIYDRQLKRANKSRRKHIDNNRKEDKDLIEEIRSGLKETIKLYNNEAENKHNSNKKH